jgi:hypothetical protein
LNRRPGDDKIMQVPLDWIGFHYYTRRIVSDAGGGAHSGGATFTCPAAPPKPAMATQPPSLMKGRLILLTDNLCFSSCLVVTDDFRTLHAFHIGRTTDAATHFIEVREQYLPSAIHFSPPCNLSTQAPTSDGRASS